jgi:hypothetical protein
MNSFFEFVKGFRFYDPWSKTELHLATVCCAAHVPIHPENTHVDDKDHGTRTLIRIHDGSILIALNAPPAADCSSTV